MIPTIIMMVLLFRVMFNSSFKTFGFNTATNCQWCTSDTISWVRTFQHLCDLKCSAKIIRRPHIEEMFQQQPMNNKCWRLFATKIILFLIRGKSRCSCHSDRSGNLADRTGNRHQQASGFPEVHQDHWDHRRKSYLHHSSKRWMRISCFQIKFVSIIKYKF